MKPSYKSIFERNINAMTDSVDPHNAGQGLARGFIVIYPYVAIISLFEYWYKRIVFKG